MAKSKSQRMKEYREKKKQQLGSAAWLKMERMRTKPYFSKLNEMSEEKREKRRAQNRESQANYRKRMKARLNETLNEGNEIEVHVEDQEPSTSQTNDESVVSSTTEGDITLTVKLPFSSAKDRSSKGGKKRSSRALSTSYKRIETLEDKNEELKRKIKSVQRRLQRVEAKKEASTPRSKTDRLLKNAGLKPSQVPAIRKKLIYGECLNEEIKGAKTAQDKSSERVDIIHRVVSGRVVKKYRLKSTMEKQTSLNRRKSLTNKSVAIMKRSRLTERRMKLTNDIVKFLERDDNSRMLPGKADAARSGNDIIQKRVLNDYLYNLHLKFLAESTCQISRAGFYRCRPKHISLVNFASRSVCLCSKHQNFCFLLRTLKTLNVTTCSNPDKFVEIYKDDTDSLNETLDKIPTNESHVKYQQWKKVKLKNGKERQRVVEIEKPRTEFIEMMKATFREFESHVQRVKDQYAAVKRMKDELPDNQVLVQMDFSENYTCNTLEEIQSAYWNACMVTLHPVVIYYKSNVGQTYHSSHVFVSDVLSHNAAMVISIIDKLVPKVRELVPDVTAIHFWTDSPSSQYRNKTIFDLVSNFHVRYALSASWHYFECGHGKGPCDGVGGTTKRNADNCVKQGKVLIQDATDFFTWATHHESGIHYEFISEEEYNESKASVDRKNAELQPLKGTMLLHAVISLGDGRLMIRNTSCACNNCFQNGQFQKTSDCGWTICDIGVKSKDESKHKKVNKKVDESDEAVETGVHETEDTDESECTNVDVLNSVEKFVVARYDGKGYIGKILEVDTNDKTVFVKFMVSCGKYAGHFKWPTKEDSLWIQAGDILKTIDEPTPTGKTGRMFSVPDAVLELIQ